MTWAYVTFRRRPESLSAGQRYSMTLRGRIYRVLTVDSGEGWLLGNGSAFDHYTSMHSGSDADFYVRTRAIRLLSLEPDVAKPNGNSRTAPRERETGYLTGTALSDSMVRSKRSEQAPYTVCESGMFERRVRRYHMRIELRGASVLDPFSAIDAR